MKSYRFNRAENGCSLYVVDGRQRRAVPMMLASEPGVSRNPLRTAAMTMLCDYFAGEDGGDAKAACLARLVANRLATRWQGWTLNEAELGSIIADVMATSYASINVDAGNLVIEYMGGERRDTLRRMMDYCVPSKTCS
jgi:hypothetical protein